MSLTRVLLVGAAAALALGAGLAADHAAGGQEECPGHWHATFLIVMDGHAVHYASPAFFRAPGRGIASFDLHADDQVMHYHPQFGERCAGPGRFLAHLGIRPGDSSLEFDGKFGANAGTYRDNATHRVEVHYQRWNGTWEQVEWSDVAHRQMRPGDKLLVTYGARDALTPAAVEAQKALVRDLPDAYLPPELRREPAAEGGDEHAVGADASPRA